MADPVHPLLDGGASAVEDNRPGRKAPGGTERANGTPSAVPSTPAARSGSPAPLTATALADPGPLTADELPDGLVVADDAGRVVVYNRAAARLTGNPGQVFFPLGIVENPHPILATCQSEHGQRQIPTA